jgi:nucleoside phosphorylase
MKRVYVIAMECEAAAVRPHLRPEDALIVSGVGKVNAAAAAMRAILEFGAGEIVNIGLAGGLSGDMRAGEIYEVDSAVEHDFDLSLVNGTRRGVKDERTVPEIPVALTGLYPHRRLATGDSFADEGGDHCGAALRDMEGAAIADVCDKSSVRFRSFKMVTDVVGMGPMTQQYRQNREWCLEKLQRECAGICRSF